MTAADLPNLMRLAESGNAEAELVLALCYRNGWSVRSDAVRSFFWLQKAANHGITVAQFLAADVFERGLGVPQDPDNAFRWMTKAAAHDLVVALERLADYHEQGFGTAVDLGEATRLRQKAAALGSAEATRRIADDSQASEPGDGVSLGEYERAADMGNAEAAFKAAQFYEHGSGVPRDVMKALLLYQRAADLGFWYANNYLATVYERGLLGQKPDPTKVVEFMNRSAAAFSAIKERLEQGE
jgi:hypothetical protein